LAAAGDTTMLADKGTVWQGFAGCQPSAISHQPSAISSRQREWRGAPGTAVAVRFLADG